MADQLLGPVLADRVARSLEAEAATLSSQAGPGTGDETWDERPAPNMKEQVF